MAHYEVWIVARPEGFCGASLDDVPLHLGQPLRIHDRFEDLFAAVRGAMDFNTKARREPSADWAIVVETPGAGRRLPGARVCTPLGYRVTAVWWPTGWEPQSPWDVPQCLWRAQGETDPAPLSYKQALAVVQGLNQQSLDHAGSLWYVLVAVENEPISQTVAYDASGMETTTQVRRMHIVRPHEGGSGDCSFCPAHDLSCAAGDPP